MISVLYEWDYETTDSESGDIIEHHHAEKLVHFRNSHKDDNLVLVCDIYDEIDGLQDRFWAYVVNGKLPTHFSDSLGNLTRKVPVRFHTELNNYLTINK